MACSDKVAQAEHFQIRWGQDVMVIYTLRIGVYTRGWWKFSLADIKKYFAGVIYSQKSLMCYIVVQIETFFL